MMHNGSRASSLPRVQAPAAALPAASAATTQPGGAAACCAAATPQPAQQPVRRPCVGILEGQCPDAWGGWGAQWVDPRPDPTPPPEDAPAQSAAGAPACAGQTSCVGACALPAALPCNHGGFSGTRALWGVSLTLHVATLVLVCTLWRQVAVPSVVPETQREQHAGCRCAGEGSEAPPLLSPAAGRLPRA